MCAACTTAGDRHWRTTEAEPGVTPRNPTRYDADGCMGLTGHTAVGGARVTVAALFVDPNGVYANLPDVDLWDEARDARLYPGPWPVVAHPPCAAWCRLAGFRESRYGYKRGEDGCCFKAALASVRRFGGVLEHPAYSAAWRAFGLPRPTVRRGWTVNLDGEASCYVEQGRYGLPVKKATWLYAYGVELPELRWGHDPDQRSSALVSWCGNHVKSGERRPRVGKSAASRTPKAFRDVLLQMARTAHVEAAA